MNSSILFLIFNRPETTKLTFQEIRKARPPRLYIAADGPRSESKGEIERCAETRALVLEGIDWDCSVHKNFRDKNLGCKHAVSSAIDWFFSLEDEGIILEDDCLPNESFFPYCEELIERYRHDNRVMQINGSNYLSTWDRKGQSYIFSKYGPIWGWASWRRAWQFYDVNLKSWPVDKIKDFSDFCDNDTEFQVRSKLYDDLFAAKIDTWDYQWGYAKMINSGLCITPRVNLITNIGFGQDATHTTTDSDFANMNRYCIPFPLEHPMHVLRDRQFDTCYFEKTMGPSLRRGPISMLRRLIQKVSK